MLVSSVTLRWQLYYNLQHKNRLYDHVKERRFTGFTFESFYLLVWLQSPLMGKVEECENMWNITVAWGRTD